MTRSTTLKHRRRVRGGRKTHPVPVPERGYSLASSKHEESHTMDTYLDWLAKYTPLTGSDGEDDPDPDPADPDQSPPVDPPKVDPADPDPADPDDDSEVKISAKELERIKNENARLNREQRKREKDEKDAKTKKAQEEGKHEELASEAQAEKDEAEKERDEARKETDDLKREIRTRDAATLLNFRDPADAMRFLTAEDTETDESVNKALKKLGEAKPYLLNDRPRSGRAGGNGGGANEGGLTIEEIKKMSTREVADRKTDVDKALRAQAPTSRRT